MPNGANKGAQNFQIFLRWMASKTDNDFRQMIRQGYLNRKLIAFECNFCKSALVQNPAIRSSLMALESNLRDRNILPSLPIRENRHNGLMIENKSIPQPEKNVKQINLDNEYLRLRVEKLEFALKRYELLEKIMSETGRIPR